MRIMRITIKVKIFNFFRNVFKIPVLERVLVSLTSGKQPHHLICKLVPNPYQYTPGEYRDIDREGLKLRMDISDYIGHYLYFGFLHTGIISLLSLCKKNFCVIDIGTNIGWTVLNFAKISETGMVIGFEPDPFNYSVCKSNIDRNSFSNLLVLPFGLGEAAAQLQMEVRTPENRGGNRIAPSNGKGSVAVAVKRLDDVEEVSKLSVINLMKLDVEGYELKVLRGAQKIIHRHKPVLFIEVDDNNLRDQGDSATELILFLQSCGYQTFTHAETKNTISASTDFSHCHFDIIAS